MAENERQQRMIERIQEDERLRGDLTDAAAGRLVTWATEKVRALTEDPSKPDAEIEPAVQAVRAAARHAARSGETDPKRLITLAESALSTPAAQAPNSPPAQETQPAPGEHSAADAPENHALHAEAGASAAQSARQEDTRTPRNSSSFGRIRRRWGERVRRWFRSS